MDEKAAHVIANHHRQHKPEPEDILTEVIFLSERIDVAEQKGQTLDVEPLWKAAALSGPLEKIKEFIAARSDFSSLDEATATNHLVEVAEDVQPASEDVANGEPVSGEPDSADDDLDEPVEGDGVVDEPAEELNASDSGLDEVASEEAATDEPNPADYGLDELVAEDAGVDEPAAEDAIADEPASEEPDPADYGLDGPISKDAALEEPVAVPDEAVPVESAG